MKQPFINLNRRKFNGELVFFYFQFFREKKALREMLQWVRTTENLDLYRSGFRILGEGAVASPQGECHHAIFVNSPKHMKSRNSSQPMKIYVS